eukprot:TRINITY_DN7909_c0_g1_i1.p1 TRINITY_DN7909_c0_g1~~TRINITY_DN7909_c0_g1_i1.p1  ORF type:complete len:349 (+),score=112.02 TRINITY_DN7909_c0_g1_i1:112-1158(+)
MDKNTELNEQPKIEKKLVVILTSNYDGELTEELDPPSQPEYYFSPEDPYEWVHREIRWEREYEDVAEVAAMNPWCCVCLIDGMPGEKRAGIEAILALEKYNLAYTGAGPRFFTMTKREMKEACVANGIPTPKFHFIIEDEDLKTIPQFNYPVFVKHHNGFASLGLHKSNKCNNEKEMLEKIEQVRKEFGGALVEEFIDPFEYTVLAVENLEDGGEPYVLIPFECCFSSAEENFKSFEVKYLHQEAIRWKPVEDEVIAQKLIKASADAFKAMRINSYSRFDFRGDREGNIFFLEANSNCGIYDTPKTWCSADHVLGSDKVFNHKTFLEHNFKLALRDQAIRKAQSPTAQ